jgi:glycosyltransferase involved in cell wall biosynthesis
MVGRLEPQKGHEVALRALAGLSEYAWHLKIVGNGSLAKKLHIMVKNLSLSERVSFLPAQLRIENLFAQSDMVLMPSLWEGLGIAAMEAMVSGRLLIASNVGGLPELVREGKTGFLFPKADSLALQKKIQWCFEHPVQSKKIALSGAEYGAIHFSVDTMVEKYEEVYTALLTPKHTYLQ